VLGVIGPRLLRLSGAIADGSVLSVLCGEEYLRFARAQIDAGRVRASRSDDHRITAFAIYSVAADGEVARSAAREALAFYASAGGPNALTDAAGISDELRKLLEAGVDLRTGMPDDWVQRLTVSGTPEQVVARIRSLRDAGADALALFPVPANRADELVRITAAQVLPRL
jgi:alkanesulfonate monooxygenase SsuD/methylene tetrahydromethanopterin reductase-like flavin-dependent oxidoreductase (luciferase family)